MGLSQEERVAWVALSQVRGIGPSSFRRVLEVFGSAREALARPLADWQAQGFRERLFPHLQEARARLDALAQAMARWQEKGIRVVTWEDPDYPPRLKHIPQAPPVLYVRGRWEPQDDWAVAVVGTRKPTPYGRRVALDVARFLAERGVTVVSGLARGIDGLAHKAALEAGGRTIAVLGSGVDVIYPPEHRDLAQRIVDQGALFSEYPPGTRPEAMNFPARNRLISGMSQAVVVVEAGEQSGALITAAFAAQQGRDVVAVPGSIYSPKSQGTLRLIQQGAFPLRRLEDLSEVLRLSLLPQQQKARQSLPQDPMEQRLWEALQEPMHIDDLAVHTGLPSAQVSALLTLMELKGLVRQVGPMTYVAQR